VIVDAARYVDGVRVDERATDEASDGVGGGFSWIGLLEPDQDDFDSIHHLAGMHELAIEDATDANQRPKLDIYGDAMFVTMKTAGLHTDTGGIAFGELHVHVTGESIIVARHGDTNHLSDVRARLEAQPAVLAAGPVAVLHAIIDDVVDAYIPVLDALGDQIEAMEEAVFSGTNTDSAEALYELKREILHFVAATRPLIGPLETLVSGRVPVAGDSDYYRDVLDHLRRVVDRAETYRELLTTIFQAHLTKVSVRLAEVGVRQNEDMRRISAWVAIAAVPAGVGGIYGMNFEHFPELGWAYGYPFALGLIAATCTTLFGLFRRAKWL
jgi:magnesium transporter